MVEQIGSIANETNTLALNASLEASRSGEQDSGISHLAEHVRQLANGLDKTKQDIESFIGSIQLATNYAVISVEEVLELTRSTEKEADNSFKTARKTYEEAERLTQSISLFKVKTQKDREREEELKATVNNILNTVRRTRKLVLAMDTQ
jgi:methyl-accepting chemotaxis protein